jgi:multiple antibiotic resistance protein
MSLMNTAVGIFTIANPIGNIPIFLSFTSGKRSADRAIALASAITFAITLLLAAWLGSSMLGFFGISLGAFQAAGGLIVILIGLGMLSSKPSGMHENRAGVSQANGSVKGIVPLGIPMMAGPGTMTLVIGSPLAHSPQGRVDLSALIIGVSLLIYLIFLIADRLSSALSDSALEVITKVMGLLLTAIGMNMLFSGVSRSFPSLGG